MQLLYVLLVGVVIWLLSLSSNSKVTGTVKTAKEAFFPLYSILTGGPNRLYRVLENTHKVLTKNGIPYCITGRTLLSAVEKENFVRGEKEATILIPQEKTHDFLNSMGDFVNLGLGISDIKGGGYRIGGSINLNQLANTQILVYPTVLVGDKWIVNGVTEGYNEYYGSEELFPGKPYKLGLLNVNGPTDPVQYLQRNFWSFGIHADTFCKKRWFQLPAGLFKPNRIPVVTSLPLVDVISDVDYRNGITIDQRPIRSGQKTVVLGNGKTAVIPNIGNGTRRFGRLQRFLWT